MHFLSLQALFSFYIFEKSYLLKNHFWHSACVIVKANTSKEKGGVKEEEQGVERK